MSRKALLIFTKNPAAGQVKTRLAATMGNEAALFIYRKLLLHTMSVTSYLPVDKFIFYSDHVENGDLWNSEYYHKEVQKGDDLGERMKNAFAAVFQKGYNSVVIIGTDCPGLSAEIIMKAFASLDTHDVVIGPAEDGGYYLLAMKKLYSALFENIQWSTNSVFDDTIGKCAALQLSYYLLPVLKDVDEEKDLQAFKLQQEN